MTRFQRILFRKPKNHFERLMIQQFLGGESEIKEVSGIPPLALPDSVGSPLTAYSITGATEQDGEPSPENPVPVRGVGNFDTETGKYRIPILLSGKNVLPTPDSSWREGYVNASGTISTITSRREYSTLKLKVDKTKTVLSISSDVIGKSESEINWCAIGFYRADGTFIERFGGSTQSFWRNIAIPDDADTYVFSARTFFDDFSKCQFQVEYDSTFTDYEPYQNPITTTIYTDKPLYSGDKLVYPDNVRTNKTGVLVLDGSQSRLTYSESGGYFRLDKIESKAWTTGFCSYYFFRNDSTSYDMTIYGKSSGIIWIRDSRFSDLDSYKAYLSEQYNNGTPVTIYYELAEPTVEPISLPEIGTLQGTNVLSVQTEVQPENVTVKYYKKP